MLDIQRFTGFYRLFPSNNQSQTSPPWFSGGWAAPLTYWPIKINHPVKACKSFVRVALPSRAQRGQKVFMQVCAGCHVMLPYAGLRAAAQGEVGAQTAEIMVAEEAVTAARPPSGGSYTPDLTALTTKVRHFFLWNTCRRLIHYWKNETLTLEINLKKCDHTC